MLVKGISPGVFSTEESKSKERSQERILMVDRATEAVSWSDAALERDVLASIANDVPWSVIETFAGILRLSGEAEERTAVDLLIGYLDQWGVPYQLHEPESFISIPLGATVRVASPVGKSFRAKTVAMSVSTDGEELVGDLVYVPSGQASGPNDDFSVGVDLGGVDVSGKVVLTEGMASPGKVNDVMAAGAVAGIFINPGQAIHEGICSTIWGNPDLDSMGRQPTIPAIAINNPDGQELIAVARDGGQIAYSTRLETKWRTVPVLVAEAPGARNPEEFVLLHGHLDAWHYGIGDNATGDATMLELARVFNQHRDRLERSVRIAWWSGHSHGRYSGSTWYADRFAIDLAKNCIAHVNCDSPGCRWADTYDELTVMSETEPFVDAVIRATTGIVPKPERPPRAGDMSFDSSGVPLLYMLSSTMSPETRAAKGLYAVGGCGGNIEWHTEDDLLPVADKDNLLRDMKMYAATVLRLANAPLHPLDWRQTVAEFRRTLAQYQRAAGDEFDFVDARAALNELDEALDRFYAAAPASDDVTDPAVRRFNFVQRRLGRLLIPVNYSRTPRFFHDPALNVPPLPDLAPALSMPRVKENDAQRNILKTHLRRGENRLVWALVQAKELVDATRVPAQ
jgi:hypothetical protein